MAVKKPPKPWTVFQERLFDAMAKRGIFTPAELARAVDVSPQTAYKWWAGQTKNVSGIDLFKIADALDVSARWLLGLRDNPQRGYQPTQDQLRVLELYSALSKVHGGWGDKWVSDGADTLNRLSVPASISVPYPKTPQKK